MQPADDVYLREFYQAVEDRPLDPDDREYVSLYANPALDLEDPVELLARSIEWAPENSSTQLLSGFRGAGKSTELRRLRKRLEESDYLVVLFDVLKYLTPSIPLDVSDFLMATAGAFGDELEDMRALPEGAAARDSYWTRITGFMQTKVEFQDIVAKLGPVDVKASLSSDPSFREMLQERAAGHLAALVDDLRDYITETIAAIPQHRRKEGVVLLVDSIENISGTVSNAEAVQQSVERLFTSHASQLRLPQIHAVYTVPPWLKIRAPGVSGRYSGGLQLLHPLKTQEPNDEHTPVQASIDALEEVVRARGDWHKLLGDRKRLDQLTLESGGHLRDLLRLIGEIIRRADKLPVDERTIERAITQTRSDLLPIAEDDARWLQRIAETHEVSLADIERLPRLVTFLDSHLVLCYRNGDEWYDVHPLIRKEVADIARTASADRFATERDGDATVHPVGDDA